METSNLSGATPTQSSQGGARALSLLLVAAVIAVVGMLLAFQPQDKLKGQVLDRSYRSSEASASDQAVSVPSEEYQPGLLYRTADDGSYQVANEVQTRLKELDGQRLEEQMRMAEVARAAGYLVTDPDFE